jgi:hypothetical protein
MLYVTIFNCQISAKSVNSAGIGAGSSDRSLTNFTISNSNVNATSTERCAAIGAGDGSRESIDIETVRISDSKIYAIPLSGTAIGSTHESDVSHLIVDGDLVLNCDHNPYIAAIQSLESISIVNDTIAAHVRRSLCFGIPPSASGSFSLAITCKEAPEESSENLPFARFTSYISSSQQG